MLSGKALAGRILFHAVILLVPWCLTAQSLDNLPYNAVQMKASHNSYDRRESIADQLYWNASQPWQGGCRALEYDIVQAPDRWQWSVQHGGSYSNDSDKQLPVWLKKLRDYSDANPNHDVITLFIDLKNKPLDNAQFCIRIDAVFRDHLGIHRLFRPRDLMHDPARDLVANAETYGWPALKHLRGKIIVVFTGNSERGKFYANYNTRDRLAFSDFDAGSGHSRPSLTRGNRIFVNLHIWSSTSRGPWREVGKDFSVQPGFVTRGWVANSDGLWNDARDVGGLNLIATDKIRNHSWAAIGSQPFRALPGAVPPQPRLAFLGTENYRAGGRDWTRYKVSVVNHQALPSEMFAASPQLPPCGLNKNASRTWVYIRDTVSGGQLQAFCALSKSSDLTQIWFATPRDTSPPGSVYLELEDRLQKINTRSNPLSIR